MATLRPGPGGRKRRDERLKRQKTRYTMLLDPDLVELLERLRNAYGLVNLQQVYALAISELTRITQSLVGGWEVGRRSLDHQLVDFLRRCGVESLQPPRHVFQPLNLGVVPDREAWEKGGK